MHRNVPLIIIFVLYKFLSQQLKSSRIKEDSHKKSLQKSIIILITHFMIIMTDMFTRQFVYKKDAV